MSIFFYLIAISLIGALRAQNTRQTKNLVCFYNSNNHDAEDLFFNELDGYSIENMEKALKYCTHLIYGYAGIKTDTFQLMSINRELDFERRHLAEVTALKKKYPHIKFLLSVGGDYDKENPEKYINLLEAGRAKQHKFIESARDFLRQYNFDGLDLALQLPRNKPRKVHTDLGMIWKEFKKIFTGDFIVDKKAAEHREEITDLISDFKTEFKFHNLMLSLTVLPNVNSSWYFDIPAIMHNVDFVNLAAFDFLTPERNPEEADFTAPLYEPNGQDRLGHYNVDFQVQYWLQHGAPANKINLGIASYGRTWTMTKESGTTGLPVVPEMNGAFLGGLQTRKPGLLSWIEICVRLPNPFQSYIRFDDRTKRLNSYAFSLPDEYNEYGVWMSYDDPLTAANKADYAMENHLGGVALFDIATDDYYGQCGGEKYSMLRAINPNVVVELRDRRLPKNFFLTQE